MTDPTIVFPAGDEFHDDSHDDPLRAQELDLLPRDLPIRETSLPVGPQAESDGLESKKPGISRRNLLTLGLGLVGLSAAITTAVKSLTPSNTSPEVPVPSLKTPLEVKAKLDEYLSLKPSLYDALLKKSREAYKNNGQKLSPEAVESFAIVAARLQFAYAMIESGDISTPEFWNALMSDERVFVPKDNPVVIQVRGSGAATHIDYARYMNFVSDHTYTLGGDGEPKAGSITVKPDGTTVTFHFRGRDPRPSPEEIHEGRYELVYTPKLIIP